MNLLEAKTIKSNLKGIVKELNFRFNPAVSERAEQERYLIQERRTLPDGKVSEFGLGGRAALVLALLGAAGVLSYINDRNIKSSAEQYEGNLSDQPFSRKMDATLTSPFDYGPAPEIPTLTPTESPTLVPIIMDGAVRNAKGDTLWQGQVASGTYTIDGESVYLSPHLGDGQLYATAENPSDWSKSLTYRYAPLLTEAGVVVGTYWQDTDLNGPVYAEKIGNVKNPLDLYSQRALASEAYNPVDYIVALGFADGTVLPVIEDDGSLRVYKGQQLADAMNSDLCAKYGDAWGAPAVRLRFAVRERIETASQNLGVDTSTPGALAMFAAGSAQRQILAEKFGNSAVDPKTSGRIEPPIGWATLYDGQTCLQNSEMLPPGLHIQSN